MILYITPWPPSFNNGGERHCYSNLISLALLNDVSIDYIGPPFDLSIFGKNEKAFNKILSSKFTFKEKLHATFRQAATSLVSLFYEFIRNHDLSCYDLIFIESTRCGFVYKKILSDTNTICCVHNVEFDFANYNGSNVLTQMNIKKSEKLTVENCKKLLFMHESDKVRMQQVYDIQFESTSYEYHPSCSFLPLHPILPIDERNNTIVFSGSLDCRYNEIGILKFIDTCWCQISDIGYTLLITGRNPSRKLHEIVNSFENIILMPNPLNIEKLIRECKLMILPDMSGTGMKLRVAEAISLGLPIVGTRNGLRGYKDIGDYGYEVNDIKDMAIVIKKLLTDDYSKLVSLSSAAKIAWASNYSFESFRKRIHSVVVNSIIR